MGRLSRRRPCKVAVTPVTPQPRSPRRRRCRPDGPGTIRVMAPWQRAPVCSESPNGRDCLNLADRMQARPARAAPAPDADPVPADPPSLRDVMARIAAEVSAPLTLALDRVLALANSGRIDRAGVQSLRDEIDGARRVGLRGQ